MITFPDPPYALSACILTSGDQIAEEFTALGQSQFVPIKIRHPKNETDSLIFTAKVNKIGECTSNTTQNNTRQPIFPSNKDPELVPQPLHSTIIYTASVCGTLIVAALTTVVCCIKKRKKRTPIGLSYDVNPVYGSVYYHQDR